MKSKSKASDLGQYRCKAGIKLLRKATKKIVI